jgi:hypothetical protein
MQRSVRFMSPIIILIIITVSYYLLDLIVYLIANIEIKKTNKKEKNQ